MFNQGPNSCFCCYLVFKDQRKSLAGENESIPHTRINRQDFFSLITAFFWNRFFIPGLFPSPEYFSDQACSVTWNFSWSANRFWNRHAVFTFIFLLCQPHFFFCKDHFQSDQILFNLTVPAPRHLGFPPLGRKETTLSKLDVQSVGVRQTSDYLPQGSVKVKH